jgi:hypothetical protein
MNQAYAVLNAYEEGFLHGIIRVIEFQYPDATRLEQREALLELLEKLEIKEKLLEMVNETYSRHLEGAKDE